MRRTLPIAAFGLVLAASTGSIALAQGAGTATTNTTPNLADRPYSPTNPPPRPETPTNYGWIGLLGLAGLAGLLPKRTVVTTVHPTSTTTRP